ncbi:glycogen debranching protein GlgX [Aureimonas altamirensis]|uniref:glycogen debranching protein GlgX n=1 Tax=Aureimonas altamirensis TaxID=370622 RepID=UPI0025548CD4|nr:glycogen debranching protein GlgX [Aureimonas altamirensis]
MAGRRLTGITAERGLPPRLGAVVDGDGAHVSIVSRHADRMELCLFEGGMTRENRRLALPGRQGDVFFGFVPGLKAGALYGYRAYGPWQPASGHRFDPAKLLVDPYAIALDRPYAYDPRLSAPPDAAVDTASLVPRAIVTDLPLDAAPMPPSIPGFTYELPVRGFSMRHDGIAPSLRGTLAALAEPALMDHVAGLGVQTVELMPLCGWIDERHLHALGLRNAWGYNPVTHMALDPRLAPGGYGELRRVVDAFHARGIRVLVDVVLNHSGESDEFGPTLSYRGLDNRLYYRTHPDDPGLLVNDTGCGNTLALERGPVGRMALDALRLMVQAAGVDGFRYDLGTVLGRTETGYFEPDAPLLRQIAEDPILCDRIHVMEPWDIGPGGYQLGNFKPPYHEWQDRFRDDIRRFWKGEDAMVGALATRLAGSADLFQRNGRLPSAGVNFIAAHDGFSLADIVAYERKHNEANGEENRDGHNENHSWNWGVEGFTRDAAVIEARRRDIRALLATLFVARGTPMLTAGDEFGRTQGGNNNAYAQDNDLSWLDWAAADRAQADFTARLAALRARHAALSADAWLSGEPTEGCDLPDATWYGEDGILTIDGWQQAGRRLLSLFLRRADDGVLVVFNAGMDEALMALPPARPGRRLVVKLRSDTPEAKEATVSDMLRVGPRSVTILVEEAGDPSQSAA